jgi:hypothetical protein
MESKNARFLEDGLVQLARKMSPAQRVRAFIEHSRQMRLILAAGERHRASAGIVRVPDSDEGKSRRLCGRFGSRVAKACERILAKVKH